MRWDASSTFQYLIIYIRVKGWSILMKDASQQIVNKHGDIAHQTWIGANG